MSSQVFMFDGSDPAMLQAYTAAQESFKYFWREVSWERRRIVPGLDLAIVKLPFTDGPRSDGNPEYEHMWVGDVDFDGREISGKLMNSPNWLRSVASGDSIRVPLSRLEDWLFTSGGRAYGGFTVNLMRARMAPEERQQHDNAWGLEFGDPDHVQVEINGATRGTYADHPMCLNMIAPYTGQLSKDRSPLAYRDERGWLLLHTDALAGNLALVKLFVQHGADPAALTPDGRSAADLARAIGWTEVADYLTGEARSA